MGGLPEENSEGLKCPLPACGTVSTGRGCVREGMSSGHVLFIKQQSQDCGSLPTFGKAREVNKICDGFCCSKNAVTVIVSYKLKIGENEWCVSFFLWLSFLTQLSCLFSHSSQDLLLHFQRQTNRRTPECV